MYYLTNNQFHSIFNSGYRSDIKTEVEKQYKEENSTLSNKIEIEHVKQIAQTLIDAVDIRENSYDQKAADEALFEADEYGAFVDFAQFYGKTEEEAVSEACKKNGLPEEIEHFIDLSLHWQNDILEWAKEIVK
jgi:hypothetical protein